MGIIKVMRESCVFIYVVAIRREMAPAPLHDHLTHGDGVVVREVPHLRPIYLSNMLQLVPMLKHVMYQCFWNKCLLMLFAFLFCDE